jgi:hypothetical protein
MHIPMAVLADEANVSQEGKLNVMGVFDRIAAASYPTVHPKMVYVFRVQAGYADSGRTFPVRVRLVDEDGGVLFESAGDLVPPEVPPGEVASANHIFALVGIGFRRPGQYRFILNVGDLPALETPLTMLQATWPAGEADPDAN